MVISQESKLTKILFLKQYLGTAYRSTMYSANILHNIHVLTTELCSKSLGQGQQTFSVKG